MYIKFLVLLYFTTDFVNCKLDLQIIHVNDFHARFEPVNREFSNQCLPGEEETCIGGVSRIFSLSKGILSTSNNTIFLNGGDNYQGTLWYTLFKYNVSAEFLSQLPFDAFVPGNHDFDDGIAGFIPFLKKINYPTIAANIDTSKEPTIAPYIKKSVVIERGGKKIGIIGYDLKSFPEISNTGNLTFSDEATAVIKECKRLKKKGVNILIALSHAGILKDIEVAKKAGDIDIIVGGHSHTFMYTGDPPNPYDKPSYPYPLVVNQTNGRKVLVVQAACYSKYIGNLTVTFDDKGEVSSYGGNPILLDYLVTTDVQMDKELEPWKKDVDKVGNVVVGTSKVELQSNQGVCYREECNMGNFITDAMVYSYINASHDSGWTQVGIAVINAGGIRTSILEGNITYADVMDVMPFQSTVDAVSVNGSTLIDILEYSVLTKHFLQWSGIEVTLDPKQANSSIVSNLKVICTECEVPTFEPVENSKYYRLLVNSFMYNGGDGFTQFKQYGVNHTKGVLDVLSFFEYLNKTSPVIAGTEDRITLLNSIENPRTHTLIFG